MEIYTVKKGDSIHSIANRYSVSVQKTAEINQLSDPNRLTVGMTLIIPSEAPLPRRSCEFYAFTHPGISENSLSYALPYLTALCPTDTVLNADGTVIQTKNDIAKKAEENGVMPFLSVTNLDGGNGFSSRLAHDIFTDESIKNTLLDSIFAVLQSGGYRGVNVSFQYIYPFDRENYSTFIGELSEKLHRRGYYLVTSLAPEEDSTRSGILYAAQDMAFHGRHCDRVIIMTYDWGHFYSSPQAVSPVDKMERALSRAVRDIPPDKILMGFSNYAYSWAIPWKQGDMAHYMTNAAAQATAVSASAQVRHDMRSRSAYFDYTDALGMHRQVWYEDAVSIRSRLELTERFGLAGISCWTVTKLWRPIFEIFSSIYERA